MLFVATYPSNVDIKEGMLQRISAIDKEFEDIDRAYLYVSFLKNWRRSQIHQGNKLIVNKVNFFRHFILIFQMIRANSNIYIHSVFNYERIALWSLKGKMITVDIHGAVPEESKYLGNRFAGLRYNFLERRLFRNATNLIHVSEEMRDYYQAKYPFITERNNIIKPIFSSNVLIDCSKEEELNLRRELGIKDDEVVFIYAGNLQAWQNFELMLEVMRDLKSSLYKFIILTGDLKSALHLLKSSGIPAEKYVLKSVLPSELNTYYSISHYGFILRDEHILNQVAAPTKLIEYMYFGIIPIVKFDRIGDSKRMGYEYIKYESSQMLHLRQKKSTINKKIAVKILDINQATNLVYDTLRDTGKTK